MILCPNCQHKELTGAIFCSNCGTQLVFPKFNKTHEIHTSEMSSGLIQQPLSQPMPQVHLSSWASLLLVDSGQFISMADRNEFTLGRISEGQSIVPDVDLTTFNAYSNGVSRLHCVIKRGLKGVTVMDLGSSNGTFLNRVRIPPHVETPIKHGDVIGLGKLKIQLLIDQTNDK